MGILGEDIIEVIHETVQSGTLCKELNTGLLCLLPKGGDKTSLKNWRPITILGTIYKIIAKTMAIRLQQLLNTIIRSNQIGFFEGRSIIGNVFFAFESMEWAIESNQPMVMLLLDFEKAYNKVEWGFLEGTMAAMAFCNTWIKWTHALYIDSWCTIRINGTISSPFKLSRSVRQGCPLAPFLYLFIPECLGYLMEGDNGLQGLLLPHSYSYVTDHEFADDTNLYLASAVSNLNITKDVLDLFSLAARAKINLHWRRHDLRSNNT